MLQQNLKTVLVTVSDDRFGRKGGVYKQTQNKIQNIFLNNSDFGVHDFRMWDWENIIKTDFYNEAIIPDHIVEEDIVHPNNKELLVKKGTVIPSYRLLDKEDPAQNGRVYKPLVVHESLKELNDGDFLIYTDCSPEMWNMPEDYRIPPNDYQLKIIKDLCVNNGGILTAHVKWNHRVHVQKGEMGYHTHENFTTERCLNRMGLQQYKYSLQHASGLIVLQKCKRSVDFVEEWLYWNSIEDCGCMGPAYNPTIWYNEVMQNFKIGHRHDQSVSGLLINKMNNKIIETLDYYERPEGTSPYLFLHFCKPNWIYNFFETNQPMGSLRHKMISPDGNPNHLGNWEVEVTNR